MTDVSLANRSWRCYAKVKAAAAACRQDLDNLYSVAITIIAGFGRY